MIACLSSALITLLLTLAYLSCNDQDTDAENKEAPGKVEALKQEADEAMMIYQDPNQAEGKAKA